MRSGGMGIRAGDFVVLLPPDWLVCFPLFSSSWKIFYSFVACFCVDEDVVFFFQSLYKSLLISDRTTVDEVMQILFQCYNIEEQLGNYTMYQVCNNIKCKLYTILPWHNLPGRKFHFLFSNFYLISLFSIFYYLIILKFHVIF